MKKLLILLMLIITPTMVFGKTIQQELKATDNVQDYCVVVIEKYRLKVKKFENLSDMYAAKIIEHDRNIDKRKMMLVHVKLTWYLKQLETEEKYCNLDDDAQLEIDMGEKE